MISINMVVTEWVSEWVALAVRVSVSAWLLAWLACRVGWLVLSLRLSFYTSWCPLFSGYGFWFDNLSFVFCYLSKFLNLSGVQPCDLTKKTLQILRWCWTMWHVLNRFIAKTTRRNEYMAAQKTAQEARGQECQELQQFQKRFQHRKLWCDVSNQKTNWYD